MRDAKKIESFFHAFLEVCDIHQDGVLGQGKTDMETEEETAEETERDRDGDTKRDWATERDRDIGLDIFGIHRKKSALKASSTDGMAAAPTRRN